jgi:hypothetical protein
MNAFLPARFLERVDRLMIGIEPVDALRGGRIALPIEVALDGVPRPPHAAWIHVSPEQAWERTLGLPDALGALARIPRHPSCRHALVFRPRLAAPIAIRLFDRARRFVPRRLRYPLPASIETAAPRIRRPALFPGAAYLAGESATGLRGRVTWDQASAGEVPVRWARVEASINGQVVGRAHGDDRGEFLLLLDGNAGGLGDLPVPLTALVTVFAPAAPPPLAADDPLGDLPLEILAADPDDVSPGELLPPGYASTPSSSRAVDFPLGRLLTRQPKFFLNP